MRVHPHLEPRGSLYVKTQKHTIPFSGASPQSILPSPKMANGSLTSPPQTTPFGRVKNHECDNVTYR